MLGVTSRSSGIADDGVACSIAQTGWKGISLCVYPFMVMELFGVMTILLDSAFLTIANLLLHFSNSFSLSVVHLKARYHGV